MSLVTTAAADGVRSAHTAGPFVVSENTYQAQRRENKDTEAGVSSCKQALKHQDVSYINPSGCCLCPKAVKSRTSKEDSVRSATCAVLEVTCFPNKHLDPGLFADSENNLLVETVRKKQTCCTPVKIAPVLFRSRSIEAASKNCAKEKGRITMKGHKRFSCLCLPVLCRTHR